MLFHVFFKNTVFLLDKDIEILLSTITTNKIFFALFLVSSSEHRMTWRGSMYFDSFQKIN